MLESETEKKETFYESQRIVGHNCGASYEIEKDELTGTRRHRITIKESDVDWDDSKEVTVTPEELIGIVSNLLEEHGDDLEQLLDNHNGLFRGSERSELFERLVEKDE